MVSTDLVNHKVGAHLIPHRITDGYINATILCQACNKLWANYWQTKSAKDFAEALASDIGIPISQLVESRRGNSPDFSQGTWVHPYIAINLAQWLSPQFAVLVSKWVTDWLSTSARPAADRELPVYVRRLSLTNQMQATVPDGFWTVFDKSSHLLILVEIDMRMPVDKYDLLDGSVGIRWQAHRQDKEWAGERVRYSHLFPDNRGTQEAWAYSLPELPQFERWLRSDYIPHHLPKYLDGKYPDAAPVAPLIERITGLKLPLDA